jgi:two-component system alkaline phosphatase synthesis response regulator PhoP
MSLAPHRILLVDDEADILEFLGYNLKKEGYAVFTATNGREAIDEALKVKPHLILMDVMMPVMDGIESCTEIRKIPALDQTLIIFLTARSEDYSQIAGFDSGADDYVTKPVKPKVLMSRIKALLRRFQDNPVHENSFTIKNLVINRDKYLILKDEEEIILTKKEFELLSLLASSPDKVFTRDEIFSALWGEDVIVGDRTIDVHIRKIREKLDVDYLKTVKGVGYKFEA